MVEYGYARVSTLEQDAQLQLDALTAAGVPADNVYVDRASGTRDDGPALLKVLAQVGEGDRLTVWRLDRLGRSLTHLVSTVDDLGRRGVAFRSLSDPVDTSIASGRMMLGLRRGRPAQDRHHPLQHRLRSRMGPRAIPKPPRPPPPALRVAGVVVNQHEDRTLAGRHWLDELAAADQRSLPLLQPPVPKRAAISDATETARGLDQLGTTDAAALAALYADHLTALEGAPA